MTDPDGSAPRLVHLELTGGVSQRRQPRRISRPSR